MRVTTLHQGPNTPAIGMHTQPSSVELLALCFLSSAAKAADPAVTLASGKLIEVSSDVTVISNAAGFPIIQFAART